VDQVNRLTADERRRVRMAQQRAQETLLARLQAQPQPVLASGDAHRVRWRLVKAAAIAALLGSGFLATQALEFKPPASLVEALLPRR
jgi:hypothetical protein